MLLFVFKLLDCIWILYGNLPTLSLLTFFHTNYTKITKNMITSMFWGEIFLKNIWK